MKPNVRLQHFVRDVLARTPLRKMILLLFGLWLAFAAGIFFAEHRTPGSTITSYGQALYWGIAAFSTAGIADTPRSALGQIIGGVWIIIGSALFFGTIVATITAYFMRPLQRPVRQIVDTIEYNLEQLDKLSIDELELLKRTTESLIVHMERVKKARERSSEKAQDDSPTSRG